MKFTKLFSTGNIGQMQLKNRIVMPPMVRNYASRKGEVTDKYLAHIESIAAGGAAMLILEASFISTEGKGFTHELGIDRDNTIKGLKKLALIAHKHNCKIGIQLYHAGRQTHHLTTGKQPVAPSPISCPIMQDPPKKLSISQIIELENKYANAALRAKEAELDFVEIHGAHGYLITQFLSPYSNKRNDKYGGSFENRLRFLSNIFLKTRAVVGNDYPILVRLSADEMVKGGLTIKDTIKISQHLEKLGADCLHISVGNYGSYAKGYLIPPMAIEDAPLVKYATQVKKTVKIPVITVGKIHQPELAEKILSANKADFIATGRSLLADPEWPNKAKSGKSDDINQCISCNQGCITRLFAQQDVQCTVNPLCGFESKLKFKITRSPKKIMVIGGGPSGLFAAAKLANLKHQVTLYEKDNKLGGQLNLAEKTPFRQGISTFKKYLITQLEKSSAKINLKTFVDENLIKKSKPDIIINATGSSAVKPPIKGSELANVILAGDIISGKIKPRQNIVIIGGGCQGAQVADLLSSKKSNVTLVELTENIALEMPLDERALLIERLNKQKVKIFTNTKVVRIEKEGVIINQKKGKSVIKTEQIVLCIGRKSNIDLFIKAKKLAKKIYNIGDSDQIGRINDCMRQAAEVCTKIN